MNIYYRILIKRHINKREMRMIYLEELIECEAFASRKEISIGT